MRKPRPVHVSQVVLTDSSEPLRHPLAGHLDQPQLGDVEDLGPGLVPGQGGPEHPHDLVAVRLDLHVDEVDDDDPADVAQPELAGDLLGRLQVVAEDRLLEVRPADVLAGVHVDDGEGLGALDDERAARRQPDLAVERLEQLLVDVEPLEQRQPLDLGLVELDPVGELGRDGLDVGLHLLVERRVVDGDARGTPW